VAHVWFNTFFEGNGPEQSGKADDSGVFEIEWDAMDGIKGSSRKGTRAFDRMAVVWKTPAEEARRASVMVEEPGEGEPVREMSSADWRTSDDLSQDFEKKLGLRADMAASAAVSRANSPGPSTGGSNAGDDVPDEIEGVKQHVPPTDENLLSGVTGDQRDTDVGKAEEATSKEDGEVSATAKKLKNPTTRGQDEEHQ
ncbi:hypothetical protein KC353_g1203, partial [Hortaea werneckii]